jgi:hypothetical protein
MSWLHQHLPAGASLEGTLQTPLLPSNTEIYLGEWSPIPKRRIFVYVKE